jgi:hypothetical protein
MKRWGLRASFLSADTNANAGQNALLNHLDPNALYTMLCLGVYFSLYLYYISLAIVDLFLNLILSFAANNYISFILLSLLFLL